MNMKESALITEESTSRSVQIDGMTVHYHEAGEGEPVIFLHSYNIGTTAWINFSRNIEVLSQHFRCIFMDLPNYGKTGPLVYNEPAHHPIARTAIALMDELGIPSAHFVGNSVGGTTALVCAIHYPDRVKKIVVGACHVSTSGDPYLIANRPSEGGKMNREASDNPTRENIRKNMLVHFENDELVTEDLVEYLYNNANGHPDHADARSKSSSVAHSNLPLIAGIKAPTMIIHGRYDRMVTVEQGLTILNYIPDSRLVVFNHCGHWPPYENPDEYNQQVITFLKDDSSV